MRPIQQHRVLKEALQHDPGNFHHQRPLLNPQHLSPLVQNMNVGGHIGHAGGKLNPFHGHGKLAAHPHSHQLPRIENSSDKEQINNLQQRVKDLEKENFKLQHHVQQAEQSIRNYREILQAHNITNLTPPISGKENKTNSKSQPAIPSASEIPMPSKPPVDVDAIRAQHQLEIKALRDQSEKVKRDMEQMLQSLRSEKDTQAKSAMDALQQLQRLQEEFKREREEWERRSQEKDALLQSKAGEQENLSKLHSQLQEQLQQALASQQLKAKTPSPKKRPARPLLEEFSSHITAHATLINQVQSQIRVLKDGTKEDLANLQHFCHQSVQLVVRRCKELLQRKELEVERLKIDHDTTIISYMEQIEDLSSQLITAQTMRMQTTFTRQDMACSPMKSISDAAARETEETSTLIRQLKKQLEDAHLGVAGLQEVHGAEIKAVKHVAHVKELQRVAREREQSLDKDRLSIELKHLK